MRLTYADTATPAHAAKVGDRLRQRGGGEVREVRGVAATLTERAFTLDDGTWIECMFLDVLFVTTDPVTGSTAQDHLNGGTR